MRRSKSVTKHDAPLRMPRRKRGDSPASSRISAASAATRRSISWALNTFVSLLVSLLNRHLVKIGGLASHFEQLGDLDAGHPDDRVVPKKKRDAVPRRCGNLTINEEILQLFVVRHAERAETVAVAAIADGEV